MEVKIIVLNLTPEGIKGFEAKYKALIEDHFRVEETYLQEGAIVFHFEKWG